MAYIDERIRLIETVPDAFIDTVDGLREDILKRLVRAIATLDTIDGRLVITTANYAKIEAIIAELDSFLFAPESEYLQALTRFIQGLGASAALTNELLNIENNPLYREVLRQSQFNVARLFDKTEIDARIANAIRSEISTAISSQSRVVDVIDYLRDYVTGSEVNQPALSRYVKTQALTAYGQAERQYVVAVGKNEGIDKWLYSGGLVKDSRKFCRDRVGRIFTTAEVLAWPKQEGYQWDGMIAGTNESNIFAYIGGWSCRHALAPVL